ncbi:hypothetical protein Dimus_021784 [Dionaea muscipula]
MMVVIDGHIITRFTGHTIAFNKCTDDQFHHLDGDGDGVLSRNDLRGRFDWLLALDYDPESDEKDLEDERKREGVADSIFDRFDADRSGTIDREEFRLMIMELMLAIARGIGNTPVSVLVEEDSLVMKAYEHEMERIEHDLLAKEEEEARSYHDNGKGKLKKRRSGIWALCACSTSGKYLGDTN